MVVWRSDEVEVVWWSKTNGRLEESGVGEGNWRRGKVENKSDEEKRSEK